jgi:hypothetical protein
LSFRPEVPGEYHVTESSEVTNMTKFTFRKRTFLNPISTEYTSYILAFVEDSREGEVKSGGNMIILADCHRAIELEFYLGTKHHRRQSLAKINRLINTLTAFRDALLKEITAIEKSK